MKNLNADSLSAEMLKSFGVPYAVSPDLNLDKYNQIIIVAHPDDVMFVLKELREKAAGCLVVSLTGANSTTWAWRKQPFYGKDYTDALEQGKKLSRRAGFLDAMKDLGAGGLILGYPDGANYNRFNKKLQKDLGAAVDRILHSLLTLKEWKRVITHNPIGEHLHPEHMQTHYKVTETAAELNILDRLHYFSFEFGNPQKFPDFKIRDEGPFLDSPEAVKNFMKKHFPVLIRKDWGTPRMLDSLRYAKWQTTIPASEIYEIKSSQADLAKG